MNGPHIAHIATVDIGLRYLLRNQLLSLKRAGYRVTGISADGPEVPALEADGLPHISVPMTRKPLAPFRDLWSLWRLYVILRQKHFIIVHTHNPKPGLLGQVAARLNGVPVIVNTLHGFYFSDRTPRLKRRFYILLERIAARCSDVILSQNREDIATAIREGIAPAEKVRWLGNGIDVQRFDRAYLTAAEIASARLSAGLPPGAFVIGFVGRLVREKGILDLFNAARLLRQRVPSVHFMFIGAADTDKPDAVMPATAEQYGVADICHFLGFRQDMPAMYALMDVFALPSYREGFPRAPMEASAMEVPCVVTDIRGCREAVQSGRNGLLVPVGDVESLADSIFSLHSDPARRQAMGSAGRSMALEQFDEELIFARVRSEYARLLQVKGLPAPLGTGSLVG